MTYEFLLSVFNNDSKFLLPNLFLYGKILPFFLKDVPEKKKELKTRLFYPRNTYQKLTTILKTLQPTMSGKGHETVT